MQVYKITNLINNKVYIGKRQINKEQFLKSDYFGSGKLIKLSITKNGIHNFKREIIEECNTKEELCEREKFWIEKMNSRHPNGYNISCGGENSDTLSHNPQKHEIIAKMIKTKAERMTPEIIKKMSDAKKGKTYEEIYGNNANKMKNKRSEEIKNKWKSGVFDGKFSGKNNGMYGVHRFAENAPMYGKKQPTEKCIYCEKKYSKTNIKRFHNENCKQNSIKQINK